MRMYNLDLRGLQRTEIGYESINNDGSEQNFTWVQEGPLEKVLANPEGIRKKHEEYEKRVRDKKKRTSKRLLDVISEELNFEDALALEDDSDGCLVCHL